MVQLSATRCTCIALLWVSLMRFATTTLCVTSERVFVVVVSISLSTQSGNFWKHDTHDTNTANCLNSQNVIISPRGAQCQNGLIDWLSVAKYLNSHLWFLTILDAWWRVFSYFIFKCESNCLIDDKKTKATDPVHGY